MQATEPMLMQVDGQNNHGVLSRDKACQTQLTTVKLLPQQASPSEFGLKQLLHSLLTKQSLTSQIDLNKLNLLMSFQQE